MDVAMQWLENPQHFEKLLVNDRRFPSTITAIRKSVKLKTGGTFVGYVVEGKTILKMNGLTLALRAGCYFSAPKSLEIKLNKGLIVVIERPDFNGILASGMCEKEGRLKYIDGASDSILLSPPKVGDPILNFLHFPKKVNQTPHTHPSYRLTIVAGGEGIGKGKKWKIPLKKGTIVIIDKNEWHGFITKNKTMDVITYHPDSDWGPTDENHPMLNKTIFEK